VQPLPLDLSVQFNNHKLDRNLDGEELEEATDLCLLVHVHHSYHG
jgi:hypothetical protein